jgi:hypothetical protein
MKDSRGHGSNARGAREERVALNRQLDERRYPTRSTADKVGALDLMKPPENATVAEKAAWLAKMGFGPHAIGIHQAIPPGRKL